MTLGTILQLIAVIGALVSAVMWVVNTIRHRSHLAQCVQDLQRHRRLDKRLIGCVLEMEHILDRTPAQAPDDPTLPEQLVGHARFLFGLRQEAIQNTRSLARHAVRLGWSDAQLSRVTPAARRCEIAHGALMNAFQVMAEATKEYERGLSMALLLSGDGSEARALVAPVRLLDESAAEEVAKLGDLCEKELVKTADACRLRFGSSALFDTKWPVRRSEVPEELGDPYQGEHRPIGWNGLGPQPMLHVDAK